MTRVLCAINVGCCVYAAMTGSALAAAFNAFVATLLFKVEP